MLIRHFHFTIFADAAAADSPLDAFAAAAPELLIQAALITQQTVRQVR